jgi:hypothetical protein
MSTAMFGCSGGGWERQGKAEEGSKGSSRGRDGVMNLEEPARVTQPNQD